MPTNHPLPLHLFLSSDDLCDHARARNRTRGIIDDETTTCLPAVVVPLPAVRTIAAPLRVGGQERTGTDLDRSLRRIAWATGVYAAAAVVLLIVGAL